MRISTGVPAVNYRTRMVLGVHCPTDRAAAAERRFGARTDDTAFTR